jgi:predicted transcriptional regulator
MITAQQIRAGRAALGWSAGDLARHSGLALRTLASIETTNGTLQARKSTLLAIKAALEAAGIEFIGTPDDAPGIRIHLPRSPAG